MSDLWQSAIGGVVGFALAQVANLSAFLKDRFYRPKLTICAKNPRHLILNHDVQVELTEFAREKIFDFEVCNRGRTVATGVQFQLLSLECQRTENAEFFLVSESTMRLRTYVQESSATAETLTLAPGAKVTVGVAQWQDGYHGDRDLLFPLITEPLPEYYQQSCEGAVVFRAKVATFDDGKAFATSTLLLKPRVESSDA
jgi:hypothetical protein